MRRYEILYDYPIDEIQRIANSNQAETFCDSLEEEEQKEFIKISHDILRPISTDLSKAKNDRVHYAGWDTLIEGLDIFNKEFPGFPDYQHYKFSLYCFLARHLSDNNAGMDGRKNFDEDLFEIRHISDSLECYWFAHENKISVENSLIEFNLTNFESVKTEYEKYEITDDLLYHFLAVLKSTVIEQRNYYFFKKNTPSIKDKTIHSSAKLLMLSYGKPICKLQNYTNTPNVYDNNQIETDKQYQQFDDLLYVLSEYNSREDILAKYLTLYHVVENFMIRIPIVKLQRSTSRMFSIREFKRIYNNTEGSESNLLKSSFSELLDLECAPGIKYSKNVSDKWNVLCSGMTNLEVDNVLDILQIKARHGDFNNNQALANNYTKCVYMMRNIIVHNKETEFHLTHANLTTPIQKYIESFLIPTLEELIFGSICKENNSIWYDDDKILLYET